MARPTVYNNAIVERSKEYLALCVDETKDVIIGQSEKFTSYKEKVIVKLPSIEGLARYLGIHKDTIYEWEKIHTPFSDVLSALRSEQAERLINMGLSGDYNPLMAKLILGKHGYQDKSLQEISGPDGKDLSTSLTDNQFNKLLHAITNPG